MIPFQHTHWIMTPVITSVAWYNFTPQSMRNDIHHQMHFMMIPSITCITGWYLSSPTFFHVSHAVHDDTTHHMHCMMIPFHHTHRIMTPVITYVVWWYPLSQTVHDDAIHHQLTWWYPISHAWHDDTMYHMHWYQSSPAWWYHSSQTCHDDSISSHALDNDTCHHKRCSI